MFDAGESSEADIQEDIEFALIQMKAETLNKINEALARLEEGVYGNCFECGEEIRRRGCAPCRSRSAARTAKRRVRLRRSASASGTAPGRGLGSSSICPAEPSASAGSGSAGPAPVADGLIHRASSCWWQALMAALTLCCHERSRRDPRRSTSRRRATARPSCPPSCPCCRCATPCSSRIPSCRSPWRARAPCA